jgi:hypothetical protein
VGQDPRRTVKYQNIEKPRQTLKINREHIYKLSHPDKNYTWTSLLKDGLVEFIDTNEEARRCRCRCAASAPATHPLLRSARRRPSCAR